MVRLKTELPYFSDKILKVSSKSGDVVPLKLNRIQMHIHARLEKQMQERGRVRAIIVKGRKQGCSTYIQARFSHKLWGSKKALRAYILTHEQPATDTIFTIAKRFQDHTPEPLRHPVQRGNAKELLFADNDCGYQVATAGTKETGRSATFHLWHGSEVAHWPNAEEIAAGAMQAVGDAEGTEIILESTANGVGNYFYRTYQAAMRGDSELEAIFIPWYWSEDYVKECPRDFEPSKEWYDYAKVFDLSWEQLYWAYVKNRELATSISASYDKPCWKYMQEFPGTADEAFQSSGSSFIPSMHVLKARRPEEVIIGTGPVILGVDPARSGDKVGLIDRVGRRMGERICMRMDPGGSVTYVAAQVASIIDRVRPDMVNIDVGSNGAGVYDILMDMGYGHILNAVNFGSNPISKGPTGEDVYFNRRAEMYDLMRQWFDGDLPVQVPDDDGLQADLTAAEWGNGKTRYNTSNELIIEEKAAIKSRIGASPDLGDAACFVKNTMIQTPNGPRPIQDLRVGDIVTTPFGPSEVGKLWEKPVSSLTTVGFSDGTSLIGTGEHKVFVWGIGEKRLDALSLTDRMEPFKPWRLLAWKASFIAANGSGFRPLVAIISPAGKTSLSAFFIAACGVTITDLFQRITTSITRMAIGQTTIFPIWNALSAENTNRRIWPKGLPIPNIENRGKHPSPRPESGLLSGTGQNRVGNGILSMENAPGRIDLAGICLAFAKNAGVSFRARWKIRGFALAPALNQLRFALTLRTKGAAPIVESRLWQTVIGKQSVVPVSVQTESGPMTSVYNLTLKRHNAYYANGILVFNCLTFAMPYAVKLSQVQQAPVRRAQSGRRRSRTGY